MSTASIVITSVIGICLYWLISRILFQVLHNMNVLSIRKFTVNGNGAEVGPDCLPWPLLGEIIIFGSILTMLYHLPDAAAKPIERGIRIIPDKIRASKQAAVGALSIPRESLDLSVVARSK